MGDIDTGLSAWRMASNHNRMIDLQRDPPTKVVGPVELAYFGSSAFRITSPGGITVMVDPWRNFPSRRWTGIFTTFRSPRSISGSPPMRISTMTRCIASTRMCCSTG